MLLLLFFNSTLIEQISYIDHLHLSVLLMRGDDTYHPCPARHKPSQALSPVPS